MGARYSARMATQRTLSRIEALVWVLMYGGLLTLVLGLATQSYDAALGWSLAVAGGTAALAGLVLIFVRAWLSPPAGPASTTSSKPRRDT